MDCRTALEILDCLPVGPSDDHDSEIATAKSHVAGCLHYAAIVESRRHLDRKIGRVMRGVHVPWNARQQLLMELTALETDVISSGLAADAPVGNVHSGGPQHNGASTPAIVNR